jgi:hypothetical protein
MARSWAVIAIVAAWVMGTAAVASADVEVTATIDKIKDKTITETITITKTVVINATVNVAVEKAAESHALVNQFNNDNTVCENCAEKRDLISGSVTGNSGIVSVNQSGGNMNNQGNAVSVAVDQEPEPNTGFAEAQAAVDQRNLTNDVDSINLLFRTATITDSINNNAGIVHVNQSPGNMNNQANAVSVAVALDGGVALAEADLGQVNTGNTVDESNIGAIPADKLALIQGSVSGNTGIVGVNQSNGNMANQANIVAIGAAASF